MMRSPRWLLVAVGAAVVTLSPRARADDALGAEATFAEGRALMKDGRYAEACAKFELSRSLERAVGTELNLAECYVRLGKTASAWLSYREAAALAQQAGEAARASEARARAAKIEPTLCHVVVHVRGDASPTLVIRRDEQPIDRRLWGAPLPVDPGEHTIVAAQPGGETVTRTVTIPPPAAPDGGCSAAVIELDAPPGPPPPPLQAPVRPRERPPRGGAQRALGAALGGLGVVGLGVGAGFALDAISKKNGAACTPAACAAGGHDALDAAGRSADVATVGLAAGVALVAAGAVLWFTAPSPARAATRAAQSFSSP